MTEYMRQEQAGRLAEEMLPEIEAAVGSPCVEWGGRCHAASLAVLRTGIFGPGRMARGAAAGVPGQHSWFVLGDDPYALCVPVVDPTIWWYRRAPKRARIQVAWNDPMFYAPHGSGSIWDYGVPPRPSGEVIRLKAEGSLSKFAWSFLEFCGPLDRRGWMLLANAPVGGWPAREIIEAIADDPQLGAALVPIDVLGMLTDRNPGGLYW